ncbi:MAG: hypothetical protein QOJ89_2590 [bacterium]|jgi:hypothetical protein
MTDDRDQQPAASVRNVGAVASLAEDTGEVLATVNLRLFATTAAGERVLDPQDVSTSLKIEPSKLVAIELSVQMSLRLRQPPSGARLAAWERIAGELAGHGIETDPATLHGLGFALVADEQLQAAQAAAGR